MRILITGGAGYLGNVIINQLLQKNYTCLVCDNFSNGSKIRNKEIHYENMDIRNFNALKQIFSNFQPTVVLHLAALTTLKACEEDPILCNSINISATSNVLNAMKTCSSKNIIFASSCAVYGKNKEMGKIGEGAKTSPISTYGKSKLAAEKLILDSNKSGINSVIFRIFNIAGADIEWNTGECHDPETHLIPLAIENGIKRGNVFSIFRKDYSTSDGTAIRDYIHVRDVASAVILSIEYILRTNKSQIINLGSGQGTSVAEIIQLLELKSGTRILTEIKSRKLKEEPFLVADISHLKKTLIWEPAESCIDNILDSALKWHMSHSPSDGLK